MSNESKAYITINAGSRAGTRILLKKDEYTIGSHRKSIIRLSGSFVSQVHAILKKRDEGQWTIQNRSSNQTLVNDQIIDTKPLVAGDAIQIGAENLLRFTIVDPVVKRASNKTAKGVGGLPNEMKENTLLRFLKRPLVSSLFVVYFFVLAALFVFLAEESSKHDDSSWSQYKLKIAINETKTYLRDTSNFIEDGKELPIVSSKNIEDFSGYDRLLILHRSGYGVPSELIDQEVDRLLAVVANRLQQLWHLEQQGMYVESVEKYSEIMQLLPNLKVPIVSLILKRIRWLETQIYLN